MWTQMPQDTLRRKIRRRLSLKCWFIGHEDWIRRTPDRLYLECFECGRETQGWITGKRHSTDPAGGTFEAAPVSKRKDHPVPALVRSPMRPSSRADRSITDHDGDMTIAA
jgi:hypothetical protein